MSMATRKTRVVVTLGPATAGEAALRAIKARKVDFVRTNMSHSTLDDLERSIALARAVGVPFIIDTEGSQIRTGDQDEDVAYFEENAEIRLCSGGATVAMGDGSLCLRPESVLGQLVEGDLLHIDFDTLVLRVADASTVGEGYVTARAITGGFVGRNKGVVLEPAVPRRIELPALSDKDLESVRIGLREGIGHIAVSFVRSAAAVERVREATAGRMKIISKIECVDALERIDEIIEVSDFLLIDRGDLSKEIPVERIPFVQKIIIHRARARNTGVFVATNLLETMVTHPNPTRAEIQDVVNTIIDGAVGLTLAAETAIGKHPIECVNMLNRLIEHTEAVMLRSSAAVSCPPLVETLAASDYLVEAEEWTSLTRPHGGRLVNRLVDRAPEAAASPRHRRIVLDRYQQMELEQIAIGAYSPLEGFMGRADLESVLGDMRLADGTVWPLPIVLDVSADVAAGLPVGEEVALTDERGRVLGLIDLDDKYRWDREALARRLYGTSDPRHPGARFTMRRRPVLLAGRITLLARRESATRAYELSPRQTRRLFQERGWQRILGVQPRAGGGDEQVPPAAMETACCDGLFVHPLIEGGDDGLGAADTVQSCEQTIKRFYPRHRVVLAAFADFCRHAGPREWLFGALCRMNFGCSHALAGADPGQRVMERCGDLEIAVVEAVS